MHVTLDHVETVGPRTKTYWFKPPRQTRYIAGQFIEVVLEGQEHDIRGNRRWFTLSSSPTEPLLGITTTHADDAGSTFKAALDGLTPGAAVLFSEPMGDFVLPVDPAVPIIFAANGIGVTPMRSMTQWLIDNGGVRDITMLYAARSEADMAFKPLFESYYGDAFQPLVGRKLVAADILSIAADKPDSLIYLAGPEPMVEAIGHALRQSGIEQHRVVIDFFSGYSDI